MDGGDETDDASASASATPPRGSRSNDSPSATPGSSGRTRSTRRKYVAESETLTSIAQDAEEKLAAKRKDRAERRELR